MSSGRDEWMSRWTEEDKQRNLKGVTGKKYTQPEFDFGFAEQSEAQYEADTAKHKMDSWLLKNNVTNHVLQAKAIIDIVMNDIGSCGTATDDHEFALWGASELLQNAADLLE